jgi:hypothetical protein
MARRSIDAAGTLLELTVSVGQNAAVGRRAIAAGAALGAARADARHAIRTGDGADA